jgi:hypothetical protein
MLAARSGRLRCRDCQSGWLRELTKVIFANFRTGSRADLGSFWEYLTIDLADLAPKTNAVDVLNDAGGKGWELIAIMINGVAYLRRQVDDPADAPDDRPRRRRRQGVG